MNHFKLMTLVATGFITLSMVSSTLAGQTVRVPLQPRGALPSKTAGESTELPVPTTVMGRIQAHAELTDRVKAGDAIAKQIMMKYKSSDFQNADKAKEAVRAYNQGLLIQKAGATIEKPQEQVTEEIVVDLPMPARTKKAEDSMASKYKELAEKCITMVDAEKKQYEERIKELEEKCAVKPAIQKKRDFVAEYEDLYKKLLAGAENPREEERLNLELSKLEREAEMAGVALGEAAEKKSEEEKMKQMRAQQMEARAAMKAEEEKKDQEAYDTRSSWLKKPSDQKSLENKLNLQDQALFNELTNATANLRTAGMVEQEKNENVLRALRHMIRESQNGRTLNSKQKDELSSLMNKIDLRLSSLGVKSAAQGAQGGSFTALPEDKVGYDTIQIAYSDPTSIVFKYFSRMRNTDPLLKIITLSKEELMQTVIDKIKLRGISFSKATTKELQAFRWALSLARISLSPTELKELIQTIDDQIRRNEAGMPDNLKERAKEEDRIALAKFGKQEAPKVSVPQPAGVSQKAPMRKAPSAIKASPTTPLVRKESVGSFDPAAMGQIARKLMDQGVPNLRAMKMAEKLMAMGKTYGEEESIPQQDIDAAGSSLANSARK